MASSGERSKPRSPTFDTAISASRAKQPTTSGHSRWAQSSFPAKLLALFFARFRKGGQPLVFLPTELVSGNGRRLASILSNLAQESRQSDSFRDWLARSVIFADTLVDRIVSEPIEPIGAGAEPYALWAIRNGTGG